MKMKKITAIFMAIMALSANMPMPVNTLPETTITADAVNISVDITLQTYRTQNENGYTVTYGVITAYDEGGNVLWEYRTNEYEATELEIVSEIGQKDNIYYFVEGGTVTALDVLTGNVIWQNSDFGGAGSNFAFGENAIYLCGFYAPDFYAVSYNGETLTRIDESNSKYIRAYKIELSDKYATVYFEYNDAKLYIDLQTYEVVDSINTTDTATSGDFDDIHWELDSDGTLHISGNGLMPGTDYQSPWNDIRENVKNIIIDEGITSIGGYAFYNFTNLEAVLIPESVTSIGKYSFANCSCLQVIDIPKGVEKIREGTFINCKNLTTAIIPETVKTVETDAFRNTLMTFLFYSGSISIETVTKTINFASGNECITNTDALIVYPFNGMRYNGIDKKFYGKCGDNAYFDYKDGLFRMYGTGNTWSYDPFIPWDAILNEIKTVVVEDGITSIGRMSFSDCENLTSVTLPNTLALIEPCAFSGCSSLSSIKIPDSVTEISYNVFDGTALYKNQTGVKYADKWVIGCDGNLTSVEIKDGTNGIASYALVSGLTSITIPNSVKNISYYAFGNCKNLTDVYYRGTEDEWNNLNVNIGNENLQNAEIHFKDTIEETTSGKCGNKANWNFDELTGTLTISGKGTMYNSVPWEQFRSKIKKIVVENSITDFYFDFNNLSSYESLKSFFIPKSVSNISGAENMKNSENVKNITMYGYIVSGAEVFAEKYNKWCKFHELNGKLALYINCEDSFIVTNSQNPQNNTFDVSINVGNISNYYDLDNVFVTLNLPDGVTCIDLKLPKEFSYTSEDKTHITGSIKHASGLDRIEIVATLKIDNSILFNKNNSTIKLSVDAGAKDQPNKNSETSTIVETISTETVNVEKIINIIKSAENNEITKNDVFRFKNQRQDYFNSKKYGPTIVLKDSDGNICQSLNGNYLFADGEANEYQISEEKFKRLIKDMNNTVKAYVKKNQKDEWDGSCFGMSRVVSLVKGGYILGVDDISKLSLPKKDSKVEDLINFYHLQQFLPYVQNERNNIKQFDQSYLLREIVNETKKVEKGGLPVQIDYSWNYTKDDEKKNAGHSVIGYKCECVDKKNKIVDENSNNFEKYKISIYDCARTKSSGYKPTYMYIGKEHNYWYYDGLADYDIITENGEEQKYITRVISSAEELNLVDYATGKLSRLCTTSYENNFLSSYKGTLEDLTISSSGITSALSVLGEGKGDLYTYTVPDYAIALDENGNTISNNHYTTYFGDDFKDEDITITLDDSDECDFSMIYSNCMVSASGNKVNKVDMKSVGAVELFADNSDYELSLTFNEGYYTIPWYTITASGDEANDVSMKQEENGIVFNSDNMENVTIKANNTDEEVELTFTADTDNVLITNNNKDDLEIYADADNNGTYETLINTIPSSENYENNYNNNNNNNNANDNNTKSNTFVNKTSSSPDTGDSISKVFASLAAFTLCLVFSRRKRNKIDKN